MLSLLWGQIDFRQFCSPVVVVAEGKLALRADSNCGAVAAAQVLLHSLTLAHQASQHTGHSTWNTRNTNTQIQNTGGSGTPSLTIPRHNTQKTHTDAQIKDTAHAWHIVAH